MNTKTRALFLIIATFCSTVIFGQETAAGIPDSLKNKDYTELYSAYGKVKFDTIKSRIYLNAYLEKAKKEDAKINMARAYAFLSYYDADDTRKLNYLDSAIAVSKNENHRSFPILAYSFKGGFYFDRWEYKKALNSYLSALEYAKKNKNEASIRMTKHNIGLIKYKIGKYEEALKMFKEELTYEEQKATKDTLDYLISVLSIAHTYQKMKLTDSSLSYGKKGLLLAKQKGTPVYYQFVLNDGINLYDKGDYVRAMDSITKSLPAIKMLEDKSYFVAAYFYLGKIYEMQKRSDEANASYIKVDSVFQSTKKYISPEVRESYESLINYYKTKKDLQQQLVYVERLLEFDSILRSNNEFLNEELTKSYDTPELLAQQERLIASINTKNKSYIEIIKILAVGVLLFGGLFYYQYQKRKVYRKRFELLVQHKKEPSDEPVLKVVNDTPREATEIADELVEDILQKIKTFEDKLEFLSQNILIRDIAMKFDTNSRYLSNIINTYKKKSFIRYVNDLRIDYTVERLKNDTKFRRYTIKAIAEEVGFNTKGAFAESFYKRTGLRPFYFINRLNEEYKTA